MKDTWNWNTLSLKKEFRNKKTSIAVHGRDYVKLMMYYVINVCKVWRYSMSIMLIYLLNHEKR
jgi:hypothetical protein